MASAHLSLMLPLLHLFHPHFGPSWPKHLAQQHDSLHSKSNQQDVAKKPYRCGLVPWSHGLVRHIHCAVYCVNLSKENKCDKIKHSSNSVRILHLYISLWRENPSWVSFRMPHLQEVQTDGCSHPGRVKQMPFLSLSGQWYGPRHCYLCHACDVQTIHHFKISQSSICIYISIYIYFSIYIYTASTPTFP